MMRWLIGGLLAAALVPSRVDAQQKGWLTDYAKARALARQTGKPLFVVFRCQP